MGLSGSSMTPANVSNDSPPPECPMHKNQPSFPPSAAGGECPASFGTGQPVMSDADINPTNMVSSKYFYLPMYHMCFTVFTSLTLIVLFCFYLP